MSISESYKPVEYFGCKSKNKKPNLQRKRQKIFLKADRDAFGEAFVAGGFSPPAERRGLFFAMSDGVGHLARRHRFWVR